MLPEGVSRREMGGERRLATRGEPLATGETRWCPAGQKDFAPPFPTTG